ncbi:MAG: 1-acyl-sn-glycerol-3-phosphate acyltransferase [Lentimicrobiaceae bacterium]|nr:1-acyl-sn-glycerol-3-phosphate acyltransferase [Lentimicrobiaceae bacterium]
MKNLFNSIRPYSEEETIAAIKQLFIDPKMIQKLKIFEDKININDWVKEILACKTQFDFHLALAYKVFQYFTKKTCTQIHFSGIENIDPKKQYLFISNHRDIVWDSTLLQIYRFENGYPASRSAIGDNLVSTPLFLELSRLHKMFLVLRSGTLKESILNTRLLSSYIHHSIFKEQESVWIAQGNGRTKNGDDKTQQGLLKMLTLATPKNALQTLQQMQITPITVSYQYEPCAQLKARELALSEDAPYIKQPGEDAHSIINGITGYKGAVNLVIGTPLQKEFEKIPSNLSLNEQLGVICEQIDRQIYEHYVLHPQNFIAWDMQKNSEQFATHYTKEEKLAFTDYLNMQSLIPDVPQEKMMSYLLEIYANPVGNKLGIKN